ncbi:hypothetical protein RYX36_033439 [Vicia faba]
MAAHYNFLKRKATGPLDQISHHFSDFSLSSPATKIRRLDAELTPIVEEEEKNEPLTVPNDERAIVLFKPSLQSSPSFSLTLNSDLISQIKNNQVSWSKQCDSDYYDNLVEQNDKNDRRLAIVPWVPQSSSADDNNNTNSIELMEADEMGEEQEDEGAMMDVEQEQQQDNDSSSFNYPTMVEGFQQHCLLPQIIPQNTSTPITWTR